MKYSQVISNIDQISTRSHHDLQNLTTGDDHTQYVPTDGSRPAVNIQNGADAGKPASPAVGDVYLANNTKIQYQCYTAGTWTSLGLSALSDSYITSEQINAGAAVSLGDGSAITSITQTTNNHAIGFGSYPVYYAQVFTTPSTGYFLSSMTLGIASIGTGSAIYNIYILNTTGGIPSGAPLIGTSITYNQNNTSLANPTFQYSIPVSLGANTQYAYVIELTNYSGGATPVIIDETTQPYTSGNVYSSSDGINWGSALNTSLYFNITLSDTVSGCICNANATTNTTRFYNFIGYALTNALYNSSIVIINEGIAGNQSSLTTLSKYYLTNTNGLISTTAGSNSKQCGIAINTNNILITNTI